MAWYVAHVVQYLRLLEGPQEVYPVWENMVLFEADSEAQVIDLARDQAKQEDPVNKFVGPESGTYLDDRPAEWTFAGVRKVSTCFTHPDSPPASGDEVAFNAYHAASMEQIQALANGDSVEIEYFD